MGMNQERIVAFMKGIMYAEGVTILPGKVMASLFLIMLLNAMTITTPFAFIPRLVKSFGTSEVDTGYKVGIIASSMFVARTGFSFFWGYLSDKYDSKKVALISATFLATSTLAFSFTNNFPWAVITRFLQGASMGLVVINKKIVANFCDHTNFSLAISILIGTYSFGLVLGPSLGGFMAFPSVLYPEIFSKDSIFAQFGVLLPCGSIAIAFYLVICLFWWLVPNQKKMQNEYKNLPKKVENSIKEFNFTKHTEDTFLLTKVKSDAGDYEIHMLKYGSSNQKHVEFEKKKKFSFSDSVFGKLFKNKACLASCFLFSMALTVAISFDETFPLYAATAKEYGGFGFSTVDIGTTLMIVSMACLISQFTILPKIVYRLGARKSYLMSSIMMAFVFPLIPLCSLIEDRKLFWVATVFSVFGLRLLFSLEFIATNIFVNNSVPLNLVGSANGFAVSASNLGRAIGVTSISTVYGWSLTNVKEISENKNPIGFPFNQYFVFFIFSIFSLICGVCVYTLPKTIDKPFTADLMESDNSCDNAESNDKQ